MHTPKDNLSCRYDVSLLPKPMGTIRRLTLVTGLTLFQCLLMFAQKNPPSEGREITKLYQEACASCHGADLSGASAPGLIDGKWRFGSTDEDITRSIHDGHVEAGMPAMRQTSSNAEIRGLVIYIW